MVQGQEKTRVPSLVSAPSPQLVVGVHVSIHRSPITGMVWDIIYMWIDKRRKPWWRQGCWSDWSVAAGDPLGYLREGTQATSEQRDWVPTTSPTHGSCREQEISFGEELLWICPKPLNPASPRGSDQRARHLKKQNRTSKTSHLQVCLLKLRLTGSRHSINRTIPKSLSRL